MVRRIWNASNIARLLLHISTFRRVLLDDLAESMGVKVEDLHQWQVNGAVLTPAQLEVLVDFCEKNGLGDFLSLYDIPRPTYNRDLKFDPNGQPLGGVVLSPDTILAVLQEPTYLCGRRLNFPIGVPASALTANSLWVSFYAQRGFDLITYKTVRPQGKEAHPEPNWVILGDVGELTKEDLEKQYTLTPVKHNWLETSRQLSMANSFGIPSTEPVMWKEDVRRAKAWLTDGQILAVSVFTDEMAENDEKFIAGYVETAKGAVEAGADIIEANFSCPNTFIRGEPVDVYHKPELAGTVATAIKQAIGKVPLFIKIGYLSNDKLVSLLEHTADAIDGVTAINAVPIPVKQQDGSDYFPKAMDGTKRTAAGVSGAAIRRLAMDVVTNIIEWRQRNKRELTVIAVGGVMSHDDFLTYRRLGADAIQCCSGAWLNPDLALECRLFSFQQRSAAFTRTTLREAEAEAKALFRLYEAGEQTLDQLWDIVKDSLHPSSIEIAKHFGLLVTNLKTGHLVWSEEEKGTLKYGLTSRGRDLVEGTRAGCVSNR